MHRGQSTAKQQRQLEGRALPRRVSPPPFVPTITIALPELSFRGHPGPSVSSMRVAASHSSGLSLSWALGQLRKQLGESTIESRLHRPHGPQAARPDEGQTSQGSLTALSCATPTSSDAASNPQGRSHAASSSSGGGGMRTPGTPLSVRWAESLEQHCAQPHAPQHAHHAPDKPCLKTQQSSFPYVEEAAQLDGLLCRPWAGGVGSGGSIDGAAVHKKRSRMAAFGQ